MQASELFDVSEEIVLVTGAASGIGYSIARILAENGARVFLVDIDAPALASAEKRLEGLAGKATGIVTDVRDDAAICDIFDQVEAMAGGVSVLVNNAGIVQRAKASRMTRETFRTILDVNVESAFRAAQEAANRLIKAERGGSIINVSSILGRMPVKQVMAYGASKAALSQMTRSLALEWGRHAIRVNEIRPGWFETRLTGGIFGSTGRDILAGQTPLRRLGEESDLDGAVLFLASRASSFVTGSAITIDGGHSLGR